ncbi:transmembrane reductase CYB561D2 [Bombyx mori]|uniref:ascorbate ferrireductase (transmembrane) n=1 Tax=Bombyx mori TaxID=7091 RepID=A0A8R2AXV3_BOMMO|nr:cytochrome b561 domain-containing protein 2 [Bombyx mori]
MMPPPPPPPLPADPVHIEANIQQTAQRQEINVAMIVLNVVNTVTHVLIGAVALSAFIFANVFHGTNNLKQHIYLCVTGYVILMSQAILTFSPNNGWTNSLKYPNKKMVHWVMQVSGSILAIAGSIIRFTNLNEHMQTAHGILGLIALILTVISLIGGVVNLIFPKQTSALILRSLHACFGLLTVSVAFICLCLGFDTIYRIVMGDVNANLSIAFTVMALIGVLSSAVSNLTRRYMKR